MTRGVARALFLCMAVLLGGALAHAQGKPAGTVYHFSEGTEQASRGLEFVRNHLEAHPEAKIVAVAHARGVDFLMKGAKTAKGNEFRQQVEDLEFQGVKFRVCEITLRERNLRREQFLPLVEFVTSGVAEIARLQSPEGFAYIRP